MHECVGIKNQLSNKISSARASASRFWISRNQAKRAKEEEVTRDCDLSLRWATRRGSPKLAQTNGPRAELLQSIYLPASFGEAPADASRSLESEDHQGSGKGDARY
jgi:hypothetical protein